MDPCGWYRGFVIYRELDGWYGETAGGTCLGPFDSFADLRVACDRKVEAGISIRFVRQFDVTRKSECRHGQ